MIEVILVETAASKVKHQTAVNEYANIGFDLFSTHQTFDGNMHEMIYTTYLTRGSRPGQVNKASAIEMLENEIRALKAEIVANGLAIKAVDARLDLTIRDFHGGDDDEAVPNNWLENYVDSLKSSRSSFIAVDDIPVMNPYEQAIQEQLAEDEWS